MKMRERIQELRLATCGLRLLEEGGDPREHEQWGVTDGTGADERGPAQRATSWPADQVVSNSNGDTRMGLLVGIRG